LTTDFAKSYLDVGLFFCAAYLRAQGVASSARAIVVLGQTLHASTVGSLPRSSRTPAETSHDYVKSCLDWTLQSYDFAKTGRFDAFAEPIRNSVDWNAYGDFAEILNLTSGPKAYDTARRQFNARGLKADIEILHDIAVGFVDDALPTAVRSFDLAREGSETAWLTTVFLRYALPRLLAQRSADESLETLASIERPDLLLEEKNRQELSSQVRDALGGLNESLAEPVRLYFGFDNPGRSVRQVASQLKTTEYRARVRIVRGLAAIAVRLNTPGVLDERELKVARELFVEGVPLEAAARRLQLRPAQVRAALGTLQAKLSAGLAESTKSHAPHER
jgi:DNA-directed RNA polymerase specialized sigma24 family protein